MEGGCNYSTFLAEMRAAPPNKKSVVCLPWFLLHHVFRDTIIILTYHFLCQGRDEAQDPWQSELLFLPETKGAIWSGYVWYPARKEADRRGKWVLDLQYAGASDAAVKVAVASRFISFCYVPKLQARYMTVDSPPLSPIIYSAASTIVFSFQASIERQYFEECQLSKPLRE